MIRELKRQGLSKKDIMEYLEYENKELYHLMETERFYSNKHISRLEKENYELKLEIERLNKECDTYMEVATRKARRTREAIEYIEKLKNFKIKYTMLGEKELYATENDFVKDLLDILTGDNNDSRF